MGESNIRGYLGKYVLIDLDTRQYETRAFEEGVLKNFVGGPSLGARILYDEMPAKTPWNGKRSVIGFLSGPTNATGPLLGGRYTVVCKSPVTNMWNDANSGGSFGPLLRKSGYDAVFVKGISEKPVYIFIDDEKVSFHDASHLWGKTIEDLEHAIKEEIGDAKVGIAAIGPGGERQSKMAAIMNDTHRAAGRGGPGAVMGSKNLKALVCRGNVNIEVHNREEILALNKAVLDWQKNGPLADTMVKLFSDHGTGGLYEGSMISGDGGIKNWGGLPSDMTEAELKACCSQEMDKRWKRKKYICHTCSIGCGAIYEIKDGKYPLKEAGRPEYETDAVFGAGLGAGDPEVVNWCNHLCNEYGFDTISFGATLAWAMECYCNGLFTLEEMGGIDLKWGNTGAIVKMAESICKADTEMGRILALGSQAAAEHYNRGFEYLVNAGRIEAPHHDPRRAPGLSRTYQYDPTPGRHVKGGQGFTVAAHLPPEVKYDFDAAENAQRDLDGIIDTEITNMAGFCMLTDVGMPPGVKAKFLTALSGFDYAGEEERKLGLRSYTIRHAFNLREGINRETNTIAGRLVGKPAAKAGPHEGITIDNEKLADHFFKAMDWDLKTLIPSKAALEKLGGLEKIIADLHGK
jgi:aldehyde:ferredoxin oxidoreductase